MNERQEVHLVPTPVVREQRALSEVGTGIEEIIARAGLSPTFLAKVKEANDAIASALQFTEYDESAVVAVGFTLWPDKRHPVVDRYIKPQGRFVLKIEAIPGRKKPQARLLVCSSKQLSNLEMAWERPSIYSSPTIMSFEGHLWRLDQLQRLVAQMFPERAATVQVVNLRNRKPGEGVPTAQLFSGSFVDLTQEALEEFRHLPVCAEWEVRVEGVRLPVLCFSIASPREEMKAYCNVAFFYVEGAGAETESALELIGELFRNVPNPFNDDAPYEA